MENWKNGHQGMATWHILYDKDRDTLIEQSLCTKYSNRAVTHTCKLEILQLIFTDAQQNRKI